MKFSKFALFTFFKYVKNIYFLHKRGKSTFQSLKIYVFVLKESDIDLH